MFTGSVRYRYAERTLPLRRLGHKTHKLNVNRFSRPLVLPLTNSPAHRSNIILAPPSRVTHLNYLTAICTSSKLEKYEQHPTASDENWGALPPLIHSWELGVARAPAAPPLPAPVTAIKISFQHTPWEI